MDPELEALQDTKTQIRHLIEYTQHDGPAASAASGEADPEKVAQLVEMAGVDPPRAVQLLEMAAGDVEKAMNLHFDEGTTVGPYSVRPKMDIKFDPKDIAATMWGYDAGVDISRKNTSRKALDTKRKEGLPAGLIYEEHGAQMPFLNAVIQVVSDAVIRSPGARFRNAFYAAASRNSGDDASYKPNLPLELFVELSALLSSTPRAALSAKALADLLKLAGGNKSTLADTMRRLIDSMDISEAADVFDSSLVEASAIRDEDGRIIFLETLSYRSELILEMNSGQVLGAETIDDVLRKKFGIPASAPRSGDAQGLFFDDERENLPQYLAITLDTQYRGSLEQRIALDAFCRSKAMESSSGSEMAQIEKELLIARERWSRLKPEKLGHLKAMLAHFKAVKGMENIPSLEGVIAFHEKLNNELTATITTLTARQTELFSSQSHIYVLHSVFLDDPPQVLLRPREDGKWEHITDDNVFLDPFELKRVPAVRGVVYVRQDAGTAMDQDAKELPAWIAASVQNDQDTYNRDQVIDLEGLPALESASMPELEVTPSIDLDVEVVPIHLDQGNDDHVQPIFLDPVDEPPIVIEDSDGEVAAAPEPKKKTTPAKKKEPNMMDLVAGEAVAFKSKEDIAAEDADLLYGDGGLVPPDEIMGTPKKNG